MVQRGSTGFNGVHHLFKQIGLPWDGRLDLDTAFVFRVSIKTPPEVSDALGLVEVRNLMKLEHAAACSNINSNTLRDD